MILQTLDIAIVLGFMTVWAPATMEPWDIFLVSVMLTTCGWVAVTLLTQAESSEVLASFEASIRAEGDDKTAFRAEIRNGIVMAIATALAIYGLLFGTGAFLFGETPQALGWLALSAVSGTFACRRHSQSPHHTLVPGIT